MCLGCSPSPCLYQRKLYTVLSTYVQLMTALAPSWTLRVEGCCSTCSPWLSPMQKDGKKGERWSPHHFAKFSFLLSLLLNSSGENLTNIECLLDVSEIPTDYSVALKS